MILGTQTLDSLLILATDVNPSTAGGIAAPIGSFGSATDGSGFFTKTGFLNTDWTQVVTGNLLSSALTGFVAGPNSTITALDTILTGFNKAQGQINGKLALSGGTMTGSLILNANALAALGAVTLQQLQAAVVGVYDLQQGYDASTNLFPTAANTNPVVATILKGFIWNITVAGTLGGVAVTPGDTILALVDSPGQTASNWLIQVFNLGYTPLSNVLNSADIFVGNVSNVAIGVTPSGVISVTNAGVFSYVNASLDLTTKVTGILPIVNGGTNSATALNNNRMMVSVAGAIVEHSAMIPAGTQGNVWFANASGLPTSISTFTVATATGNVRIGGGTAPEKLSIVNSSGPGLGVVATALSGSFTSSGTGRSLDATNSNVITTAIDSLAIIKTISAPTIGSGQYIRWDNQITGPSTENVGRFGVIMTDVTAGTFKTKFVWQTPNEIDGTIVDRMALTSNGVLQILGSIIPTGYVTYKQLSNIVNSNTVVSTTAETLFSGTGITLSVPASTLRVGDRIKVTFRGIYSRTSGSLTSRLKNNAVTMLTAPALTLTTNTDSGFKHEAIITILTIGVGGTCRVNFQTMFGCNHSTPDGRIVASNGTRPINTTILQLFTFSEQWSISNAANTITTENADWEILKAT